MKSRRGKISAAVLLLVSLGPLFGQELDPRWIFAFGDPRFKEQTVEITPGRIVSMATGQEIPFDDMIRELAPVPFVLIGESHEALPTHELQARIVRALHAQDVRLAVGLEMVAAARQEVLSRWSRGELTDDEFLRGSKWYSAWSFHFGYYRSILDFARDNRLPLHALDTPQEVAGRFQVQDGVVLSGNPPPAASAFDPVETDDRLFLKKSLASSDMPAAIKAAVLESMLEDLFRAQAARDKEMAARTIAAHREDGRTVVVLVGAGHLMFGLGLHRQVREQSRLAVKSIVPVIIPKGSSTATVSRTLADYIVGIEAEDRPAYPEIGLTFKTPPDPTKIVIASPPDKGAARGVDFQENDLIVSVDDRTFPDSESLLIYLAGIPRGGTARFRIRRRGVEMNMVMNIPAAS